MKEALKWRNIASSVGDLITLDLSGFIKTKWGRLICDIDASVWINIPCFNGINNFSLRLYQVVILLLMMSCVLGHKQVFIYLNVQIFSLEYVNIH